MLVTLSLVGCDPAPISSANAPRESSALVAEKGRASAAPEKADHIAWSDAVTWRDWETALRMAKEENKSVCLVVYADWCPHCKELAPVFAQPAIASAAAGLIMVRQDQDADAPWLKERLGAYGDYVPRVLFLDPNGNVHEDLQSGHPRYPYFYAPMVTDRLLANMRAASRR